MTMQRPSIGMLAAVATMAAGAVGQSMPDDGWHGCRDRGGVPENCLPRTVRGDRNSPCPCGSGKKFKKCCRGKTVKEPTK